jgi:hypothetical protein
MKLYTVACVLGLALPSLASTALGAADGERDAKAFVDAVRKLNEAHARKPGETREQELTRKLPKKARTALARVLKSDDLAALESCSAAALDLALVEDFEALRARRAELEPESAANLPVALARDRFLLVGENGLDVDYLEDFAEVFEDVLGAYDQVFGFEQFSKVPGKKLRVRVHLEPAITRPPYFAPEFRWHSQIDFPVVDGERFRSPTAKGQFLLYGLCHELGHVVAMWGDRTTEEDHHAWAHYAGLKVLEHLNEGKGPRPKWLKSATDYRWRKLAKERAELKDTAPSFENREGVLAFLYQLDELIGPRAIGAAINELDRADKRLRINRVRYYSFEELAGALDRTLESKRQRKAVKALFPR